MSCWRRSERTPENAIWLWSLGRLGARIPLYGPLSLVVSAEIAGEWLKALLELPTFTAGTVSAIVLIARRTDDHSRDIDDAIREQAISHLLTLGIADETIQLLSKYIPPETGGRGPQLRRIAAARVASWSALQTACCLSRHCTVLILLFRNRREQWHGVFQRTDRGGPYHVNENGAIAWREQKI